MRVIKLPYTKVELIYSSSSSLKSNRATFRDVANSNDAIIVRIASQEVILEYAPISCFVINLVNKGVVRNTAPLVTKFANVYQIPALNALP